MRGGEGNSTFNNLTSYVSHLNERGGEGRDDGYTYCNRYVPKMQLSSILSAIFWAIP